MEVSPLNFWIGYFSEAYLILKFYASSKLLNQTINSCSEELHFLRGSYKRQLEPVVQLQIKGTSPNLRPYLIVT